jgi:hypothetical protein
MEMLKERKRRKRNEINTPEVDHGNLCHGPFHTAVF